MMKIKVFVCFMVSLACAVTADAQSKSTLRESVRLELSKPMQEGALVHWRITNNLATAVYVYDLFLWGPAYHVVAHQDRVVVETTPVTELRSCPPNRNPPVLLLLVGPHRNIEGDFTDSNIKDVRGKAISMRIAVGNDPYSVVALAKRYMTSDCQHSPYDAIIRWGAILESNVLQF
jgi:hypothetical protein